MPNIFAHLLFYQFAFLYLLALVIGLAVYGSDFDSVAGWLYVSPIILIAASHRWIWARRFVLLGGMTPSVIYSVGAIAALLAYSDLHLAYWDEHSAFQAGCLAVLGICSYLSSVVSAVYINNTAGRCGKCHLYSLFLLGLLWWPATWYPMVVVFWLALLLALAAVWYRVLQASPTIPNTGDEGADPFARYVVFLLAIDLSSVVWDYQVNTQWAIYLAIGFIAAAFGGYLGLLNKGSDQREQVVYVVTIFNFILATLFPVYLLAFAHIVITGACLGFILPKAVFRQVSNGDGNEVDLSFGWITWFFLGLVVGNGWYANLSVAAWRIVLIIPFLLILVPFLYFKIKPLKYKV